ncbi:hypothetical protein BU52_01035 [Streptomyces toyocaensis]|uniref:Uncharacterized protein n=1 Tax=Streptomyces toyocaensis TaxID=55952 RepID=A0A081XYP1_STRTO|nr:hypothetical protein [Streptomyces toyocaensis]KES08664.1 hypothetical protein BU52_01035 [Streptomyces toyocaensis]
MKQTLEVLGFLAVVRALAGPASEFAGWDRGPVHGFAFLEGHEIHAGIAPPVPGGAPFAAAESRKAG